jgi:hypothetical protein
VRNKWCCSVLDAAFAKVATVVVNDLMRRGSSTRTG